MIPSLRAVVNSSSATEEFFVETRPHFLTSENEEWAPRILVVGAKYIHEVDPSTAADVLVLDRQHLIDAEVSADEGTRYSESTEWSYPLDNMDRPIVALEMMAGTVEREDVFQHFFYRMENEIESSRLLALLAQAPPTARQNVPVLVSASLALH